MKKEIKSILFTGGGTLGHIFPIIPVVRKMKQQDDSLKVYFIGTTNGLEREYIESTKLFTKTFYLDSQGFKRKLSFYNLQTLYKYFIVKYQSKKILKALNCDMVVGMGGYITGAVLRSALDLKMKTVIHEQNSVYGLTNKLLKKKVDLVLLAYNIEQNKKTFVVGNPRISEIYQKYKYQLHHNPRRNVLVVGGSRGANRINDLILSLKDEFEKRDIEVLLITGNKYYQENINKIKELNNQRFIIKGFVQDLPNYLIDARVVVTRCGATTLAEIMALKKIALLIPSPNVTNNHQEKNALEIVRRQGALMIKENDLTKEILLSKIINLLDNEHLRKRMINHINMIVDFDSCEKFIKKLDELMDNRATNNIKN